MATKAKDSCSTTPRKEKKVSQRQGKQGSTEKEKPNPSGKKPVPNYLRPTLSSRTGDPPSKKPGNEDSTAQKTTTLLRRRSFDRPPPATSRMQKPFMSPERPGSAPNRTASTAFRSPKPALERASKSLNRAVRSQPPLSPSTKSISRSSSLSKSSDKVKKIPSCQDITQTLDLETIKQESSSQEEPNLVQIEADDEEEKMKNSENCTVSDEQSVSLPVPAEVSETGNELDEEGETSNGNLQGEEIAEGNVNENGSSANDIDEEEKKDDAWDRVYEMNLGKEGGEDMGEEAKEENSTQKLQGGQGGKKESPGAYNDVIEETKNKLMEKRKNKVKALVGAFETVIDYESAASK